MKDTNYTINCKGKLINIDVPKIMAIINVTPDSFYDGGKIKSDLELLKLTEKHLNEGADFLDVGGYSSRPNAENISVEEEKKRVLPAIEVILKQFPETLISIDTFRSEIADEAIKLGACMVNDISAFELDEKMPEIVKKHHVPYIIMHMKGNPRNMQKMANYDNILTEITHFLSKKVAFLQKNGISDIIIDPGFGFGKTIEHNYTILKHLEHFQLFNLPTLCGFSRKSMIWKPLNITPEEALNGTTVLNTIALFKGCNILRVHDVKGAYEAIQLTQMLK
ncbi:MAG: dihydropteroate synthase [Bacteroidia bacterium]